MSAKIQPLIKLFAFICCGFNVLSYLMSACGYVNVYEPFGADMVTVYALLILQAVALFMAEGRVTRLLLTLAMLYPKDVTSVYVASVLLLICAAVGRLRRRYVNLAAVASVLVAAMTCFIYFLPAGYFITHTGYKTYTSPDKTKTVAVCIDYSFGKEICYFPIACKGEVTRVMGTEYYFQLPSSLRSRYTLFDGEFSVRWIDDETVEVCGAEYKIDTAE